MYSEPFKTSKIKFSEKIVNEWKTLTVFAKRSILDICQGSHYASRASASLGILFSSPTNLSWQIAVITLSVMWRKLKKSIFKTICLILIPLHISANKPCHRYQNIFGKFLPMFFTLLQTILLDVLTRGCISGNNESVEYIEHTKYEETFSEKIWMVPKLKWRQGDIILCANVSVNSDSRTWLTIDYMNSWLRNNF